GRAYVDTNGNSSYDVGEPTALTDSSGNYSFSAAAGTFNLREVVPTGYRAINPTAGVYAGVVFGSGATVSGENFGDTSLSLVQGTVYNDANANATLDGGETGLSGVRVYVDANNNSTF